MEYPKVEFLYLNEEDMVKAGVKDMAGCIEAMEEMFKLMKVGNYRMGGANGNSHGCMVMFPPSSPFPEMPVDGPDRRFMAMPAYLGGKFDMAGMKWYGSNCANKEKGLPRSILMLTLNDKDTGAPVAYMSANILSAYRTGAVPGVGYKHLSRPDSKVAAIIGPGVMSKTAPAAIMAVRPGIETVKVKGRGKTSLEKFIAHVKQEYPQVNVYAVDTMEEAVRDADIVSNLGISVMKGINENNVIPVVKHFPGHGITKKDSHILLPYTFNYKEVLNKHILPFKEAIDNGCDCIMISHIVIRKLTQGLPSSLSKKLIKEYLREKIHYDNLVITDDIRMKPVDLLYKSVSLKKAFTSGADIILFKYRKDDYKVINKVIKMVKKGEIKEEDIDKSVARILRIKEKYNISDKKKINGCNIEELNKQIEELNSILN